MCNGSVQTSYYIHAFVSSISRQLGKNWLVKKIPFFLFISFSTFFENIIIVFVFALHIMFFFHFNQDKIFFVQSSEFLICKPFLHWCKSVLAEPLCCLHWYQSKWSQLIDLALSSICYSFRDQRLVWAFDNLVPLEVIMIFFLLY